MANPREDRPDIEPLSAEECLAWCDRYRTTPWNMLTLATVSDKQPSPMVVFGSMERLLRLAAKEPA